MRTLILCLLSFMAGQCTQEAAIGVRESDPFADRTQDYRGHFGPITDTECQEFYGVEF